MGLVNVQMQVARGAARDPPAGGYMGPRLLVVAMWWEKAKGTP
jgi:hypothetical protein